MKICEALPLLASITGGYATVTDGEGRRIKTFDSSGRELEDYAGTVYELAAQSHRENRSLIGESQIVKGAQAWVLPVGPFVVSCSNVEKVKREQGLKRALEKALPLIARVAGGEAVLFDREGKRLASYNPDGTVNKEFLHKVSEAAKRAMELHEPVIGDSMSYPGAMAVRIPITRDYGMGFNNELAAKNNTKLYEEVKKFQYARYNFSDIIGESEVMRRVIDMGRHVARGMSTILIYGETGTGKELFAQAIHNASERSHKPFVAINCGALPASLIESNLFGYVEGAFTGAKRGGAPGIFEQAQEGTIFLDEISEMELNLQAKLLRVLQEKEVTRIGGDKPIPVNVRVLASTNKDLEKMVREGKFRSDLYFRLNVVELKIPPLRERASDIPHLVMHFIRKYNALLGKYVTDIEEEALEILVQYRWPGNVRELQNCIEHAINMVKDEQKISAGHLPPYIRRHFRVPAERGRAPVPRETLAETLARLEKEVIEKTLREVQFKKKEAAEILGISTTTLWRKMVQHGLQE
ncbi:MAG TPA: sigma 54-interacting transcriptional regulator [Clostridia bacterium]|nr:sigma 54-interacting transcriptional regulator [Clostridia bacterium]